MSMHPNSSSHSATYQKTCSSVQYEVTIPTSLFMTQFHVTIWKEVAEKLEDLRVS